MASWNSIWFCKCLENYFQNFIAFLFQRHLMYKLILLKHGLRLRMLWLLWTNCFVVNWRLCSVYATSNMRMGWSCKVQMTSIITGICLTILNWWQIDSISLVWTCAMPDSILRETTEIISRLLFSSSKILLVHLPGPLLLWFYFLSSFVDIVNNSFCPALIYTYWKLSFI